MSNSSLVTYTKLSPNKNSPRNHKIDTITIHHVVGQASVETIGDIMENPAREMSSNYGIGADGRVGLYVDESDRSWCSSSDMNDNRAITIECADDNVPPFAINDAVYATLIELCTDICKRNGITELKWVDDHSLIGQVDKQNMTVHRWFSNTACPGEYIFENLGRIAYDVNAKLNYVPPVEPPVVPPVEEVLYRVQVGAFSVKENAEAMLAKVKSAGFDTYMVKNADGYYKIQVGAYSVKANAEAMSERLRAAGFANFVTNKGGTAPIPVLKTIDEIAHEVLKNMWGNGLDRQLRLTKAGYNYTSVQTRVNELLG